MGFNLLNNVITQSGTDDGADLVNSGVANSVNIGSGDQRYHVINLGSTNINITGHLTIDTRKYMPVGSGIAKVTSSGKLTLGNQSTAFSSNYYPWGIGWLTGRRGVHNYSGGGLQILGTLELLGGGIISSSAISFEGGAWKFYVRKGYIQKSDLVNQDLRIRMAKANNAQAIDIEDCEIYGFQVDFQANQPYKFKNVRSRNITFGGHFINPADPVDIESVPEAVGVRVNLNQWSSGPLPGVVRLYGCADPGAVTNIAPMGTCQYGGEVRARFSFHVHDKNENPLANVKVWTRDTNNGKRTGEAAKTTTNQGRRNFVADQTYTGLSDANGEIASLDVLLAFIYRSNARAERYDLDGKEVVDSRMDEHGHFVWKFFSYLHLPAVFHVSAASLDDIRTDIVLQEDEGITEKDMAVVAAYTEITDMAEAHDYGKYRGFVEFAGNIEKEITLLPDGTYIIHGGENIHINPLAAEVLEHDDSTNTVTIKGREITGRLRTTGRVTFANGGKLVDGYLDNTRDVSVAVPGSGFQRVYFYATTAALIANPGGAGYIGSAVPGESAGFLFSALNDAANTGGKWVYYVVKIDSVGAEMYTGKLQIPGKGFHSLELKTRTQIAAVQQNITGGNITRADMEDKLDYIIRALDATGIHQERIKESVVVDLKPPTGADYWNAGSKSGKISVARGSVSGTTLSPDNSGVFQLVYHCPADTYFTHVLISGSITGAVSHGYNITISAKRRGTNTFDLLHSDNPGRLGFTSPFIFSSSEKLRKIYGKDYQDVSELEFTITPNLARGTSGNRLTLTELQLYEIVEKAINVGTKLLKVETEQFSDKAIAQIPAGGGGSGLSPDDIQKIDTINTTTGRIASETGKLVGIERTIGTIDRTTEAIEVEAEKNKRDSNQGRK